MYRAAMLIQEEEDTPVQSSRVKKFGRSDVVARGISSGRFSMVARELRAFSVEAFGFG